MTKRIQNYVKYTAEELDNYLQNSSSCVKKVNTTLRICVFPIGLREFKKSLVNQLAMERIGCYDKQLHSIVLDIRNIKFLDGTCAIRFDDPRIHVKLMCDCYVFQPVVGAVVKGIVRHVSFSQLGVIIYRVFSVTIRLVKKPKTPIAVDTEIYLKMKKFDLEGVVPYIEGELVEKNSSEDEKPVQVKKEVVSPVRTEKLEKLLDEMKKEDAMESDNDSSD